LLYVAIIHTYRNAAVDLWSLIVTTSSGFAYLAYYRHNVSGEETGFTNRQTGAVSCVVWFLGGTEVVQVWNHYGTPYIMTARPRIEDETVEEINEKLRDVMEVDPESVGLDTKINVLLSEYSELRFSGAAGGGSRSQDRF
jgi:hypothetical protein